MFQMLDMPSVATNGVLVIDDERDACGTAATEDEPDARGAAVSDFATLDMFWFVLQYCTTPLPLVCMTTTTTTTTTAIMSTTPC
jgi:hypothetical protein